MKTRNLFLAGGIALLALNANANVWRVNNNSNYDGSSKWGDNFGGTVSKPVFKQLSQVNSSNLVLAGDTIHLEGSSIVYDGATVSKKLVILGPGYLLNENPNTNTNPLSAEINNLNFDPGSEGSQLIGVYLGNSSFSLDVNASDITIERCRIDYDIYLDNGISNIQILQNYFSNINNSTSSAISTTSFGFPTDVVFNNNICKRTLLVQAGSTIYYLNECKNNTFDCPAIANSPSIQMNVGVFQNNILKTPGAIVNINSGSFNKVSYNISASANNQFGNTNNNIVVTNISSIFVPSGTTDGVYQIKNGSVADNSGSDGTDCGAFGNIPENSYTLSGLAPIPVIYQIITTGVAGPQGLPVTIKARTIK